MKETNEMQVELIKEFYWCEHPSNEQVINFICIYASMIRELINLWFNKEDIKEILECNKDFID